MFNFIKKCFHYLTKTWKATISIIVALGSIASFWLNIDSIRGKFSPKEAPMVETTPVKTKIDTVVHVYKPTPAPATPAISLPTKNAGRSENNPNNVSVVNATKPPIVPAKEQSNTVVEKEAAIEKEQRNDNLRERLQKSMQAEQERVKQMQNVNH